VNVSANDSATNVSTFIDFDNRLVGWWRMDDVNTTGLGAAVYDYTGVNNGTAVGNASQVEAGYFGKGFGFDGLDGGDYIMIDDNGDGFGKNVCNNGCTFSAWAKKAGNNGDAILGRWNGGDDSFFYMHIESGNRLEFWMHENGSMASQCKKVSSTVIDLDVWYHYVGVYDNSTGTGNVSSYQDGVYKGSTTCSWSGINVTAWQDNEDVFIGTTNDFSIVQEWNGTIDDVMIFNRTLSAEEIVGLYANTSTKYLENNFTGLADGNHTFRAYAQDEGGNVNSTELRTVTVDVGVPTVTIVSPVNNSNFNESLVLFNVTGSESLDWCGLSIDGLGNVTMGNTSLTSFNYTNSSVPDGSHSFVVSCNDSVGNMGVSGNYSFFVDVVYPGLEYVEPSPRDGGAVNETSVTLNVSVSDASSGTTYALFDDGLVGWWRMDDVNGSGDPLDISGEGNDGVANGNASQVRDGRFGEAFEFDGDGDYVDVGNDSSLNFGNFTNFTLNIFWIKYNHNASAQGLITKRIGSAYWQWKTLDNGRTQFLIQGPSLCILSTNKITNDDKWHMLSLSVRRNVNVTGYVDGSYDSVDDISSCDGNVTNTQYLGIGGDQVSSISFNGTIDEVLIFNRSLSAIEIQALYNSSNYSLERNLTGLAESSHSYTAFAVDEGGNVNSSSISFEVDLTAPDVDFEEPTLNDSDTTGEDWLFVNVSANDSATNVSTFIDFDNSLVGWWRMDDVNTTGLGAAVYDYTGVNNGTAVGNASQVEAGYLGKGFGFDGSDNTDIDVENEIFSAGTKNFTVSVWFSPRAEESRRQGIVYSKENQSFGIYIETNNLVKYAINTNVSTYLDTSQNPSENQWTHVTLVYIENNESVLYFNGVKDESSIQAVSGILDGPGGITIGSFSDISNRYFNGSIDDVMIFNRSLSAEEIVGLYANTSVKYLENNFTGLVDGNHTFRAYAQDEGGNVNSTELRTVTVDVGVPTVTIVSPVNNSNFNESSVLFNVTGSETLDWCGLSLDGLGNVTMGNTSLTSFNYTNSSVPDGSHNFSVSCNDTAGNVGVSDSYNFFVDTVYPDVAFEEPTLNDSGNTTNDWLFVNVSANDSASNVSTFIDFDNSLVGWWRMDDVNTTGLGAAVYDYTGVNNGTAVNQSVQTDAGALGKGFEFDGDGDYVDVGNDASLRPAAPLTYAAWFKASNSSSYQGIITNDDNTSVYAGVTLAVYSNNIYVRIGDGLGQSSSNRFDTIGSDTLNTNIWYHAAIVVYAYNNVDIYLNAINDTGKTTSGTGGSLGYTGQNARVGVSRNDGFNGTIDDVMIFNRTLSVGEIQALYANQSDYYLTNNFTSLADGNHTFRAYAQDEGGNVNSTELRTVTAGDVVDPTVTIVVPVNNSNFNESSVLFNVTGSESLDWCGLSLDGLGNVTMGNTSLTSFNYTNSSVPDGSHSFVVSCNDSSGNVGCLSWFGVC
jgi:hypothetical protein